MKFNASKFIFLYQNKSGILNDHQRQGLTELLTLLGNDEHITDIRWAAYMLATTKHETADTFLPIAEYGLGKGKKYGDPVPPYQHVYYGRGYTQNTWIGNYKMLSTAWNVAHPDRPVDFVKDPDLLLVPEYSYFAMSHAMRLGAYTGASLKQKIHDDVCDYVNARRIINGLDCADKIAGYATNIEAMLKGSLDGEAA
jgi:hypothetical protein